MADRPHYPAGSPLSSRSRWPTISCLRSTCGWLGRVTNAFLIRAPREMIASLAKVLPHPTVADTGLPQQLEIFEVG